VYHYFEHEHNAEKIHKPLFFIILLAFYINTCQLEQNNAHAICHIFQTKTCILLTRRGVSDTIADRPQE